MKSRSIRNWLFPACVVGALLALPGIAAAQVVAYTNTNANLRAGPDFGYPMVAYVPYDTDVQVYGCIDDYTWCDVATAYDRGWIAGVYLDYFGDGDEPEVIGYYGVQIGLPIIGFWFDDYWNTWYRNRSWYAYRNRWAGYRPPPRPMIRPPQYRPPRPPHFGRLQEGDNRQPQFGRPQDGYNRPPQFGRPQEGDNRPPQFGRPQQDGNNHPPQFGRPQEGNNRPPQFGRPQQDGNDHPQQFGRPPEGDNRPPQFGRPQQDGNNHPQQFGRPQPENRLPQPARPQEGNQRSTPPAHRNHDDDDDKKKKQQ